MKANIFDGKMKALPIECGTHIQVGDGLSMAINQDDFIKTALRLPRDLHAAIQEASDRTGRSMNAEIIERLKMSFAVPEDVAIFCQRNRQVEDRWDLAVRVLSKAGVKVEAATDPRLPPIFWKSKNDPDTM